MEQPRTPDGRYTFTPSYSSGVKLDSAMPDDQYNAQGTFEFPPVPRSYEQHRDFWLSVPVDDNNLRVAISEYARAYREEHKELNDLGLGSSGYNEKQRVRELSKRKYDPSVAYFDGSRWQPNRPETIPNVAARQIVRAGMMMYYSTYLSEEDQQKVRDTPIDFGNNTSMTAGEIYERYRFRSLGWTIAHRDASSTYLDYIYDKMFSL